MRILPSPRRRSHWRLSDQNAACHLSRAFCTSPSISSCVLSYMNNRCKADATQLLLHFSAAQKSSSGHKHSFITSHHGSEMIETVITKAYRLTPSRASSIQLKNSKAFFIRYVLILFNACPRSCYFLVWFSGTKINLLIFSLTYSTHSILSISHEGHKSWPVIV